MTSATSTSVNANLASTRPSISTVGIGMAGFGTVGTGTYKMLSEHPGLQFKAITVRDTVKARSLDLPNTIEFTNQLPPLLSDPTIHIIIEVIGGVDDAYELVTKALKAGKHVVTANKELVAKHGPELFALATEHNVRLLFEAAVAGGIPIILPLKLSLAGNRIEEIAGILNGTTNYILTQMTQEGLAYEDVLKDAQAKGFAEADPTNDVEGYDAGYKLSILASIASKQWVNPAKLFHQGISTISKVDIENARALGYTIKLLGLCRWDDSKQVDATASRAVDARVHPMLVSNTHPLASIHNENNAVWVRGHAVGDVMFYGKGAGELPTASAVAGDVLAIASGLLNGNNPIPDMSIAYDGEASLLPADKARNQYYVRVTTKDEVSVIGHIGNTCGEFGVSLDSVMQKGCNDDGTAIIVFITHEVSEANMQQAIDKLQSNPAITQVGCVLRVLG